MTLNRISVFAAPIAILVLFGSALIGRDALAFRDVSHFYTPLYDYVAHRTGEAWIPLWNPLDATGMPLLGETTTAVLYPPRYLIFSLPISSDVAMSIYVALHLIFASWFASLAARWAGASRPASRIAGAMYPLSGSILFLYTNPPFLVGACWLPVVIASLTSKRAISVLNRCLIAGPAIAMMITGGDPQTALHAALVATAFWMLRRIRKTESQAPLRAIILSCSFAGVLAAPQLAASIAWSGQSERILTEHDDHWLTPPAAQSRRMESYQFSLPPWHAAEILTPNAFGSLFPIHSRLSSLIPGDGRMWTPTIYLGSLAALMILARCLRLGRRPVADNSWIWLSMISLFLSFGHFGVAWVFQQIPGVLPNTDSATGGPYWLLYQLLPGYDAFRYPAKWLPVFSLALSIAVSLWIDQPHTHAESATRDATRIYFALILIAAATLLLWRYGASGESLGAADHYWGPFSVSHATHEIAVSILHSTVALLAIFASLRMRWVHGKLMHVLLLIVIVDLGAAAYINVAKVHRFDIRTMMDEVDQTDHKAPTHRWMRTQFAGGWPHAWRQTSNFERLTEVAVSERICWFGRWHLQDRQAVFNSMVSIRSRAMSDFWSAAGRVTESMHADQRERFWKNVRTWLKINGVLHSSDRSNLHRSGGREYELIDVTKRDDGTTESQFYFSVNWSYVDSDDAFDDLLRDVHRSGGKPTDLVDARGLLSIEPAENTSSRALVEIDCDTAEKTIVRVHSEADGVLVRSVFQDGEWKADVRKRGTAPWISTEVFPVNFITQGIELASGDWEIRFRYEPGWLPATLVVSAAGWLVCTLVLLRRLFRQFRNAK